MTERTSDGSMRMIYRWIIAILVICGFGCGVQLQRSQAAPLAGLNEGWTQEAQIPEVKDKRGRVVFRGASLKMWVEKGWLVVRREQPNGYWDWQIVLAQANDTAEPQVNLGEVGALEINYGRYFIREGSGRLRVYRERKTAASPPWPAIPLPLGARQIGVTKSRELQTSGYIIDDWYWSASGVLGSNDLFVRVNHRELTKKYGGGGGPMHISNFGDYTLQDEGDLFVGQRQVADDEQVKELIAIAKSGKEPKSAVPSKEAATNKNE